MAASLRCGSGAVLLNGYGAPAAFVHDRLPGLNFLLSEGTDNWHTADRAWGSGFIVTDDGTSQWAVPDEVIIADPAASQEFG